MKTRAPQCPVHGCSAITGYRVRGCRCEVCSAHNVWLARRHHARLQGIEFTLTPTDMGPPPEKCPVCDTRMVRGMEDTQTSPSMDRLVPELGYVPGNVVWICRECNSMKRGAGPAELYQLADWLWGEMKKRDLPLPSTRLYPDGRIDSEARQEEGD